MAERMIFLDLETTGLNPRRHPIMQLAAIAVDQSLAPLEATELKIRFREQAATRASLRKNHYSAQWYRSCHEVPSGSASRLN
ncbi:MAG: exonuclease domain-containing protein [Planctomycetia bacterium]|nr:exonuclease domain-containing protein [Planctomycetia bacterium]